MNSPFSPRLRFIASQLKAGGVCAYPTEAVWGLGCDPFNGTAVDRILALKQRKPSKGLILVAANIEQLGPILQGISEDQYKALQDSWPGPNTWLVPDNGYCPAWIRGDFDSVALRVSAHPVVAGLCQAFGGPLVSTSANPQGLPPARNIMTAHRYFHGRLDGYAPGLVNHQNQPSTIRDLNSGQVLRT